MAVEHQHWKGFPAVEGVRWFNLAVLVFTPLVAFYGILFVPLNGKTLVFSIAYYFFTVFVLSKVLVTGGHDLIALTTDGKTDTDKDPYDSTRGLAWSHIGWILFKTKLRSGSVDISDLANDPLVKWSHRYYFPLAGISGYIVPALIPVLWNDFWGGLCFSTAFRMTVAHHSVFAVNSIAHYLGSTTYDDSLSPRDHFLSGKQALLAWEPFATVDISYSDLDDGRRLSQFPPSISNGLQKCNVKSIFRSLWYQWDPTKWFIALCKFLRLANNLRVFPSNEIAKGALTMRLKSLKELQDSLAWPPSVEDLPVITAEDFQEESKKRHLILISGFVHDVSDFLDNHPGGVKYLTTSQGMDQTAAFFGGVYRHSNAAHNLLSMMRVGVLAGGSPPADAAVVPPAQALFIERKIR
ncbi:Acyl-CoA desaturase [Mycena sanguinolenta]|uniref:Acyl-CoA desaturase n=1 Tax=Mycena sanguinolenta TaxID=230812 RepID=A0A8H7DE69_9AGAR|nr:Acyl-CoA desaturase [Mycena sanguinolenta]